MSVIKKKVKYLLDAGYFEGFTSIEFDTIESLKQINLVTLAELIIVMAFNILYFYTSPLRFDYFLLAIVTVMLLANLVIVRNPKKARLAEFIGSLANFILVVFLFLTHALWGYGLIWIFPIPVLAFYLGGKRRGLIWGAIYLAVYAVMLYLSFFDMVLLKVNPALVIQSFVSIALVLLFTFLYETAKEKRKKLIKHQLYTDSLTQLPNRHRLMNDLQLVTAPTLILVNIDEFKEINDFYGHTVGDFLITQFGNQLKHFLDELLIGGFEVYRLHSDEFAVLLNVNLGKKEIRDVVKQLHQKIEDCNFQYIDTMISVGATFGIVMSGKSNILESADIALKLAKRRRKHFLYYIDTKDYNVEEEYANNIKWSVVLKDAIKQSKIIVYYQPIINNATGKLEKYECLARLMDENGKVVLPSRFLKIAKRSKLYSQVTKAVITEAFRFFDGTNYGFSVNISVDDILNPDTSEFILGQLEKYQHSAHQAVLEILESDEIERYSLIAPFIKKARSLGAEIALDDFGTGYSNWEHITKLDIDYIKIDGSLISRLSMDEVSEVLVKNIAGFSKQLGIKTVAEYVNSKENFQKVVELGLDYSQGFYLGRPKPTIA